jgi:hypothetical protein
MEKLEQILYVSGCPDHSLREREIENADCVSLTNSNTVILANQ